MLNTHEISYIPWTCSNWIHHNVSTLVSSTTNNSSNYIKSFGNRILQELKFIMPQKHPKHTSTLFCRCLNVTKHATKYTLLSATIHRNININILFTSNFLLLTTLCSSTLILNQIELHIQNRRPTQTIHISTTISIYTQIYPRIQNNRKLQKEPIYMNDFKWDEDPQETS